jgi:hypothetical protein
VYLGSRPGTEQFLTDIVPAYQINEHQWYKEFSALQSGGVDRFSIGGVTFTDGITLSGRGVLGVYNLNGQFTSLSGVFGQVDGTNNWYSGEPYVRFFADGRLVLEILLTAGMYPENINIDLTGVNQLKIEMCSTWNGGIAGIGNPVIS